MAQTNLHMYNICSSVEKKLSYLGHIYIVGYNYCSIHICCVFLFQVLRLQRNNKSDLDVRIISTSAY